jgi:dipeptidyl aminopeptidase/acylaminoacyl peptidase
VKLLIDGQIADKSKICIMGGSYGGYAALMGVAKYSDTFACAISIAGVSDLNKLMIDERSKGSANYYNHILIGDDYGERKASSPITYVKDINRPVFLAHGTEDGRVNYSQSVSMYNALKGEKKDVTFLKLKDETHNLEDVNNRIELFEAIEKFLEKHIGRASKAKE